MTEKEKPAYLGHRKRVRERIKEFGFGNIPDVDLLEYLLFYALPRRDTYTISRRLIKEFGNLRNVLNATKEELCKIDGIGEQSAYFLTALTHTFRAYEACAFTQSKPLSKLSDTLSFLKSQTIGARGENFVVLYLDKKLARITHESFSNDDWRIVSVHMDHITRKAININAYAVIIGHNHITGKLFPSEEDISSSSVLSGKLDALGVKLIDSIIFDDYDFYSFKENGLL